MKKKLFKILIVFFSVLLLIGIDIYFNVVSFRKTSKVIENYTMKFEENEDINVARWAGILKMSWIIESEVAGNTRFEIKIQIISSSSGILFFRDSKLKVFDFGAKLNPKIMEEIEKELQKNEISYTITKENTEGIKDPYKE